MTNSETRRWFDLQVNGSNGLDFNSDDWSFAKADVVARQWISSGCEGLLPTVITDDVSAMSRRVARIRDWYRRSEVAVRCVAGIHVEGPFISEKAGYVGAHPVRWTCDADKGKIDQILAAGDGMVRLWTLAPERDPKDMAVRRLCDAGVVVSAGHTEAEFSDLDRAIEAGLTMFTHLGNGCPSLLPRHDNVISRVLSRADRLTISLIADGHHIPWFALREYIELIPNSNLVIVSDSMQAAGLPAGRYLLGGQTVIVDEDRSAWSEDRKHFAGSATTLDSMMQLLSQQRIANEHDIDRWCCLNPKRVLGVPSED
ncbi:MAG: N-acetylglucosamine-6-phosphate deacetylase [Planctomycetota bacterium]